MDAERIAVAVERCIADATHSSQPFRTINEFLSSLKRQSWSDDDRQTVQTRVLVALKQRREAQASGR